MDSKLACSTLRICTAMLAMAMFAVFAIGQDDPDPNSPTPILLSAQDSTRALTTTSSLKGRKALDSLKSDSAYEAGSTVNIFFTNVSLMKGEGANAFRVYATAGSGQMYRFPVLSIEPVVGYRGVYSALIRLTDDVNYWPAPKPGDLAIYLTWRGLASNVVKLGVGATGGLDDIPGTFPTPLSTAVQLARQNSKTDVASSPNYVGYRWSGDRMRFLEQTTFGPTQDLDQRIRRIGIRTWLAEQFQEQYPSANNPYPNIDLRPSTPTTDCDNSGGDDVPATCYRDHYTMYPVQTWFYKEAMYGTPQLRHRVDWALNELWVISGIDTQQSSHMLAYHQAIDRNVFGNWRQLMYDVTLNAGMGNYLDMIRSTKTNPNENYPREVMQLFNIGLVMLNQDGTVQVDGQGHPIPTYDQTTITNFTKVFTGWRDCRATDADPNSPCPNALAGSPDYKDPMSLNANNHDLTAKTLLSYPGSTTTTLAACTNCTGSTANMRTYAYNSLNQALDNIYDHPNVAPFVSRYLIQSLVTSDPTPAYVGRVAAVFNANRTSATQMQAVIRAILLDPEARGDVKTDPVYGKLREPVQLMTNLFRQVGTTSADGTTVSDGNVDRFPQNMAQRTFYSPTVFNFYPPTYEVPGTTLNGPEFAIFNTGTAIARANFANSMCFGQINVSLPDTPNGTKVAFGELQSIAAADTSSNQLLDVLNQRFMHGTMSSTMRESIRTAVNAVASSNPLSRAQTAVYLVLTSSQYQVQK